MPDFRTLWQPLIAVSLTIVGFAGASRVGAAEALVAVSSNFVPVAKVLAARFEKGGEHRIRMVNGSTGQLYSQIVNGAPFDAFLAADQSRPILLEQTARAVENSRFTYAVGRLCLWSPDPERISPDGARTLRTRVFRRLAIANPRLAPYGMAAEQTLRSLGLREAVAGTLVLGENVGQAYALVATGNAELGFVSLAQVLTAEKADIGSRWDVPIDLYSPIRQDAILLRRGRSNAAATDFLRFLAGPAARQMIESYGYGVD